MGEVEALRGLFSKEKVEFLIQKEVYLQVEEYDCFCFVTFLWDSEGPERKGDLRELPGQGLCIFFAEPRMGILFYFYFFSSILLFIYLFCERVRE